MTKEEIMHEWKNKALLMCDVDNCIIDADGKISKETDKALRELINVPGHAYYFGMMSYRPVMQVKKIYDTMELRPTSYLIGTKGAEVYSLSSDQFMIHQFIDPKTAQKIYDELIEISKHNSKLAFHVSYDGVWNYLHNVTKDQWGKYNIGGTLVLHDAFEANNVTSFVFHHLDADFEKFEAFANTLGIRVAISGRSMTLLNKDVNLANSFEFVVKHLSVAPTHIAVMSKTINDKSLFEIPGVYGITSKDADEELKKVAKLVLAVEEKDFVAEAIKCFKEYLKTVEIK